MTALPPSGSFARVDPAWVAEVGPAAAILYARIQWRADRNGGEWVATRSTLAAETGLTDSMLRTAVKVLREAEWVTTRRVSADDATLIWTPITAGQADIVESAPPYGGIHHTPPAESTISSSKTITKTTPPLPPPTDADVQPLLVEVSEQPKPDVMDGFDFWWERYPRKTAKAAARRAWAKAIKDGATARTIVAGLRTQWQYLTDQHQRGFCPHPSTWLNQERWTDEAPRPQQPDNVHHLRPQQPLEAWVGADGETVYLPPPKTDAFG